MDNKINRREFSKMFIKVIGFINVGFLILTKKAYGCDFASESCGSASDGCLNSGEKISGSRLKVHAPDSTSWGNDEINYGINAAVDSMYSAGYQENVGITAVSLENGGDINNHNTHEDGTCYDFLYYGKNGEEVHTDEQDYDRNASYNFINELGEQQYIAQAVVGDSTLASWLEDDPNIYDVKLDTNDHMDHMHIQFHEPNDPCNCN